MRCVSTNRPSLRLFARLECQECVLFSEVGGRVEESLTDPGQLSAAPLPPALGRCGTLSLRRLFTQNRLTLPNFIRGVWGVGGGVALLHRPGEKRTEVNV